MIEKVTRLHIMAIPKVPGICFRWLFTLRHGIHHNEKPPIGRIYENMFYFFPGIEQPNPRVVICQILGVYNLENKPSGCKKPSPASLQIFEGCTTQDPTMNSHQEVNWKFAQKNRNKSSSPCYSSLIKARGRFFGPGGKPTCCVFLLLMSNGFFSSESQKKLDRPEKTTLWLQRRGGGSSVLLSEMLGVMLFKVSWLHFFASHFPQNPKTMFWKDRCSRFFPRHQKKHRWRRYDWTPIHISWKNGLLGVPNTHRHQVFGGFWMFRKRLGYVHHPKVVTFILIVDWTSRDVRSLGPREPFGAIDPLKKWPWCNFQLEPNWPRLCAVFFGDDSSYPVILGVYCEQLPGNSSWSFWDGENVTRAQRLQRWSPTRGWQGHELNHLGYNLYLEPNWPLCLKVNRPKPGPKFQSKQGAPFGFSGYSYPLNLDFAGWMCFFEKVNQTYSY